MIVNNDDPLNIFWINFFAVLDVTLAMDLSIEFQFMRQECVTYKLTYLQKISTRNLMVGFFVLFIVKKDRKFVE